MDQSARDDTRPDDAHDAYFGIADESLPGGGLGSYSLPDDVRFVIRKGEGSRIQDVRGRWYIDYVGGAGALVLGHAFPTVAVAISECRMSAWFVGGRSMNRICQNDARPAAIAGMRLRSRTC